MATFRFILIFSLLSGLMGANAQSLIRSSINSFGTTMSSSRVVLQQTAGQSGNYNTFTSDEHVLRQGFQQGFLNAAKGYFSNADISLYPNPSNGQFNLLVKTPQNDPLILEVFNILGDRVHSERIMSNSAQVLNLQNQASGLYFLRLISPENDQFSSKLILTR
jgi:hypothetical protein